MAAKAHVRNLPALLALTFLLSGCGSSAPEFAASSGPHFGVGRPHYTVRPYQVNGVWYYPKVDYDYDETGTASWYGPGFDRRATADGEIYDMNGLSAAHKTLPLPSVVEVTNLQNGRELRLRVNDRGPFIGDRLIDVSRRAAQMLGFERSGTAQVRVRVLKDDSIRVAQAAMRGEMGNTAYVAASAPVEVAEAAPPPRQPVRVAAAVPPPSLRAAEVVAAPFPTPAPPITPQPEPAPAVEPAPVVGPAPIAVARAEPEPRPRPVLAMADPPRPTHALASRRHFWPSLIPEAHAEPLPTSFGLAVQRAARRAAIGAPHSGRIFVQAGAFAVPENAHRLRKRVSGLGNAEVVHGDGLYRVRLGPVGSEAEARRLIGRLAAHGFSGARLVDH